MSPRKNVTYSSHPTHAARSAHAKGDKLFRTYDTTAIRPKRNPVPAIIGIVVLIALLIFIVVNVLGFLRSCGSNPMLEKGKEVEIVVADGEGSKSVAKKLYDAGLIANTSDFTDRLSQLGAEDSLQPGTYTLVGGQSVDEMISVLQAPVASVTFTVPEGSTIRQTAEIVSEASGGRISADDFVAAASNASVYANDYSFLGPVGTNSLEGYLFPKTYPISDDSTADSIIRAMLDQFGAETAGLDWSKAEAAGLSRYDVVKLASIIEKEADAENRETVSSVFYNRLYNGMALQSDATVAYVVGHDPTPEDVETYSDYNTYFVEGLNIPTPINSPSLSCLQAACSPAQTNYLYFYFEEDGNGNMIYHFTETYEEHQSTFSG